MVQWIQPILQNLGLKVFDDPTLVYKCSQPTIDIIKANNLTSRVKHISVPIHYFHDKCAVLTIYSVELKTTIHPKDTGTKISSGPLIDRHQSYICAFC